MFNNVIKERFGDFLLFSAFTGFIVYTAIFFICYKRGIDVTKNSFLFPLVLVVIIVFVVIPIWLTDMSLSSKIIGSVLAIGVGTANYFIIDKRGKRISLKGKQIK